MKLLVTGGAGYIGSVVTAELVRAGHDVTVFDNLSKGHCAAVTSGAKLVRGDVSDRAALATLFRVSGVDGVLHFAAFIEAGESMRLPEKYFRNNAALYGNPERTPIQEDDALHPTNAYGQSKLLVEQMLEWFHRIHGLRYASLRYFNAAGASGELGEDHHPETHLIPLVLQVALSRRANISIFGTDYPTPDGTCVRDYIHVSDLASAHVLALEALGKQSEPERLIYNLGNGRGFSVHEVIETARRVTGHRIPAVEAPRRSGDPAILVASSEKIKREQNWQPQHAELDAIIASAWEWRRRRPEGYGD